MKTKKFLIGLSMVGFLAFSFTSCSDDGSTGIGESGGGDPPRNSKKTAPAPTPVDTIDVTDLPED